MASPFPSSRLKKAFEEEEERFPSWIDDSEGVAGDIRMRVMVRSRSSVCKKVCLPSRRVCLVRLPNRNLRLNLRSHLRPHLLPNLLPIVVDETEDIICVCVCLLEMFLV